MNFWPFIRKKRRKPPLERNGERTITRRMKDQCGLDDIFKSLPKLQAISLGCRETGNYSEAHGAHVCTDGWICVMDEFAAYLLIGEGHSDFFFTLNRKDERVPCTVILHEYAHIIAAETYHHHSAEWEGQYARLCINFDVEQPPGINMYSGQWGEGYLERLGINDPTQT